MGHFLATPKPSEGDLRVPSTEGETVLFVIGTGKVSFSAEKLLPGTEVLKESYTSIGTKDRPLVAATVLTREPTKGLTPQQFVTHLISIDPKTMEVLKTSEVFRSDTEDKFASGLTGSDTTAVAFNIGTKGATALDSYIVFSYDALSGQKLWERPGIARGQVLGATVVAEPAKDPQCGRFTGVEISTGKELYSLSSEDLYTPCNAARVSSYDGKGATDNIAERQKYVRFNSEKPISFDAKTGQKSVLPEVLFAVDPHSEMVVGGESGTANQAGIRAFTVTDAATGSEIWKLDKSTAGGLSATVLSLYRGLLYVKTADQAPVVDVKSGNTIVENSVRYPLGAVDDWTFWSDGVLDKSTDVSTMSMKLVREQMLGTWSGAVTGDSSEYTVKAIIKATPSGMTATVEYPELKCTATWTETSGNGLTVALKEKLKSGRCVDDGVITLLRDGETLAMAYDGGGDINIRATLEKQ